MSSQPASRPVANALESQLAIFVRDDWERDIAVLPGATDGPFVSEQELFEALVRTGQYSTTDKASQYTVWVGTHLQENTTSFAAKAEDATLQGYLGRLTDLTQGQEFTVLLPNPHRYDPVVRRRVREFATLLAKYSGVPCGGFDSGIFLGRYGKTPFGVHRGQMSVLTFPVLGTKRFLLWPRPYGEQHVDIQDSLSYDHHVPKSSLLTIRPGDIGYWPADYWHIADGPVTVSAAVNIGLWWDRPSLDASLQEFAESLSNDGVAEPDPRECFNLESRGSGALEKALDRIVRAAQSPATRMRLQMQWLAMKSAAGMRDPFPRRSIDFGKTVAAVNARLMPGETIHTMRLATGQLGVSLLGASIAVESDANVTDEVARLNRGHDIRLDLDALRRPQAQSDRGRFHRVLAESLACELRI